MKPVGFFAPLLAAASVILLSGSAALADGGKGVAVRPLQPRPGDVITVKGDQLGANREVEIRVVGAGGVNVDLGEVQADAAGDFTAEFRLPTDLAVGTYQVQARGAETVTAQITVRGTGATSADAEMGQAPVLRTRPRGESIVLVAIFGVLAGIGILFAQTAHRKASA